jgi:hypothetical protein
MGVPKRRAGPVESATKRDLDRLPKELAASALGASALALARELDAANSATSKSMCAKAHMEIMDRLRELAPLEEKPDALNDIESQRAKRLALAGVATATD